MKRGRSFTEHNPPPQGHVEYHVQILAFVDIAVSLTRLRLSSHDWLICMAACTSLVEERERGGEGRRQKKNKITYI